MDTIQRIYQLIIDAGGSKEGADVFRRAAETIASSSKQAVDSSKSLAQISREYENLVRRIDPAARSQQQMGRDLQKVEAAFRSQQAPIEEVQRRIEQITQKYDTGAKAARQFADSQAAAIDAARQLQFADNAQASFNQVLGVVPAPNGAARASAAVFEEAERAAAAEREELSRLSAQAQQLVERHDLLAAAQRRYGDAVETANAALARGIISSEQYEATLAREQAQLNAVQSGLGRVAARFGSFGTMIQQAGYQVGDFAVQVASGSGVLRPLIQQGTQLLSAFGPWGAVIGAAGAVIGALATSLIDTHDAADDASEAVDAYADAVQAAEDITRKLHGENQATVADLQAERRYRLELAEAALAEAQAKVQAAQADAEAARASAEYEMRVNPEDIGATAMLAAAESRLNDLKAAQDDVILNQRKLVAELKYGGEDLDSFAKQGTDFRSDFFQPKANGGASSGSSSSREARRNETKDISDQRSALNDLIRQMQDENTLLSATGAAREALARQREIDAAVVKAQADAERDYQSGLRDTEILTQDELDRIRTLAGSHYDLAAAQTKSGDAGAEAAGKMAGAVEDADDVTKEFTGFLDQSFDRVGSSLTDLRVKTGDWGDAIKQFGNVSLGILSEFEQELFKLTFINPFKNWINGNDDLPDIGDLIGRGLDYLNGLGGSGGYHGTGAPSPALPRADGGYVAGPGGPRSDSINARLSNGEFVVNAYSTARARPLLEAINTNRLPGFADGGFIASGVPAPAIAGSVPVDPRLFQPQLGTGAGRKDDAGVTVNVINNTSEQATTRQSQDAFGRQMIEVVIGEVAKDMARGGRTAQAAGQRFGLNVVPGMQRA